MFLWALCRPAQERQPGAAHPGAWLWHERVLETAKVEKAFINRVDFDIRRVVFVDRHDPAANICSATIWMDCALPRQNCSLKQLCCIIKNVPEALLFGSTNEADQHGDKR